MQKFHLYYFDFISSTMTAEIKAKLKDIQSKEHLEFNNFQIFKQEKVDRVLEKFPKKYCEIQEDSSEDEVEITHDSARSKEKGAKKKKKPTLMARKALLLSRVLSTEERSLQNGQPLFLNSGDNDIANFTQDALNKKYNLTVH